MEARIDAALTRAEVDTICHPLKQGAAQIRYLRDIVKVPVQRKPDGRPLVRRSDWERSSSAPTRAAPREPKWSKSA